MMTITSSPVLKSQNGAPSGGMNGLGWTKLPLYTFGHRATSKSRSARPRGGVALVPDLYDIVGASDGSSDDEEEKSFLDSLLLAKWEDRMDRGLFRYDVTACQTKVLDGEYGFIAQLNEGRHSKKRPTEIRVDEVLQAFDGTKFNFTKVSQEEALFGFEESESRMSAFEEDASVEPNPNVVLINVSPIEYGHVLLVPRLLDCLSQHIQSDTLLLALHMAVEVDNPYFRLGYNSLGAYATINHLHFQAYYMNALFPIERARTTRVPLKKHKGGLKLSSLHGYPVLSLVYDLGGAELEDMAVAVAGAAQELERRNIAFNILIADCGRRVFLIPQCFAEQQARGEVPSEMLESQVNPAVWEISGHIVLKRMEDYDTASEGSAWRLLAHASLPKDRFEEVKQVCVKEANKASGHQLPGLIHSPVVRPARPHEEAVVQLRTQEGMGTRKTRKQNVVSTKGNSAPQVVPEM